MVLISSVDILPLIKWFHPIAYCWVGEDLSVGWWYSWYARLIPLIRRDVRYGGVWSWVNNWLKLFILTYFRSSDSVHVRKWSWSESLRIGGNKGRSFGCRSLLNWISTSGGYTLSLSFGLHTFVGIWMRIPIPIQLNCWGDLSKFIFPLGIHESILHH